MIVSAPLVTIAVPSFNQGRFLEDALRSIDRQGVPVEVFLMDGGSSDETGELLVRWRERLAGWRSRPDDGQAAAINEGIARGTAPFVCWLNSDDWFLDGGLEKLVFALQQNSAAGFAYGKTLDCDDESGRMRKSVVLPFSEWLLARLCLISQPGTLIRRAAWECIGGVNPELHMAMDYDLWWRLFRACGAPAYVGDLVAVNRVHSATKTNTQRHRHYQEAIDVVKTHYGRVPWKWYLMQPYAVWWRSFSVRRK